MVTATDSITPSNFAFEYLDVEALDMQQMNLQLGFPANVTHVIRPGSPLWNLSLQVRALCVCGGGVCVWVGGGEACAVGF
jgi:hypothetical protein